MNILFLVPEQPSLAEGSADGSIGVFDPDSLVVGRIGVEFPVGSDGANQPGALALGKTSSLLDEDFVVDFAEGGCKVDDSSSRIDGDKVCVNDAPLGVLLATA